MYAWFAHTLLDQPLDRHLEKGMKLLLEEELTVNISGSDDLKKDLTKTLKANLKKRFRRVGYFPYFTKWKPKDKDVKRIEATLSDLFPSRSKEKMTIKEIWVQNLGSLTIRAYRVDSEGYSFPVFKFMKPEGKEAKTSLIYLPKQGTYQEIPKILHLLESHDEIISIDYLGIGELKSNRVTLHNLGKSLMHNAPSLPEINIGLLESYVRNAIEDGSDLYANGWASSFYGVILKHTPPHKFAHITLAGVPLTELEYLNTGEKIPDLLLQGNLFANLTVEEAANTFDPFEVELRD